MMSLQGSARLFSFAWMSLFGVALAQTQTSSMLAEKLPESVRKQTPTFILGDRLTSQTEAKTVIEGHAELRKTDTVLRANRIEFDQASDIARAKGEVLINRLGNRFWGPDLELDVTNFKGFFNQPSYQFYKNGATGNASRVDFLSEKLAIAKNATFSTCKRPEGLDGKPWKPDWILSADEVAFDVEEDVAKASGSVLRFKDVPILALPGFSFPLSDKRKSGFLAPTIASDSISGFEYTQPYYWNISPSRDLTFYPTYIAKRGLNQGGEFRYLEPNYKGELRVDYLANDALRGDQRWGYSTNHRAIVRSPFEADQDINWRLSLNRVSDDNYWRDFPRANGALTQRLLSSEFNATALLGGWNTQMRAQRWQTLQDTASPITPPFDRVPQITTRRNFYLPNGLFAQVEGDFTIFSSTPSLTGQANGKRFLGIAQISRPWLRPEGYVTPKLQLHSTAYQIDPTATSSDTFRQRILPTFSLDSGLFYERDSSLFGNAYKQTLEPRAFYVRTPYRNQSLLPNYDSAAKDFTLATIYSENPYVGNDRIADMNMLTLGLTSRYIDSTSGVEALRMGIAQRYRFSTQNATLPTEASQSERLSDWLVHTGMNLQPNWSVDGTVQFGVKTHVSERTTLSTRYNPTPYRALYAAYRMQNNVSEQMDIGWQWPLGDLFGRKDDFTSTSSVGRGLGSNRWYSVGRLNYSTKDQRMVGAIIGFEYDADCWVGRIVLEQTQLDLNTTNQRVMFQLEFSGFARVGISPLASLKQNIPRYQNLREQITSPSRFSQYD
jgi:LPS-assembly protein